MRVYRIAAVVVSTVLLVVLIAMLNVYSPNGETPPTSTAQVATRTDPRDSANDGVISVAERAANQFGKLTVDVLNLAAKVACDATVIAPDKFAVRRAVLARARQIYPDVSLRTMAAITDKVAMLACAEAYAALPEENPLARRNETTPS